MPEEFKTKANALMQQFTEANDEAGEENLTPTQKEQLMKLAEEYGVDLGL